MSDHEMGRIIPLRRPRLEEPKTNDAVASCLAELLRKAQAGEIHGFAYTAALPDGAIATEYVEGDANLADLVYGAAILHKRLIEL